MGSNKEHFKKMKSDMLQTSNLESFQGALNEAERTGKSAVPRGQSGPGNLKNAQKYHAPEHGDKSNQGEKTFEISESF